MKNETKVGGFQIIKIQINFPKYSFVSAPDYANMCNIFYLNSIKFITSKISIDK